LNKINIIKMVRLRLRMPSNKTLGNICVYGAVASISAVMYMRWKMEDRVRSCEYYKLALKGTEKPSRSIQPSGGTHQGLGHRSVQCQQ